MCTLCATTGTFEPTRHIDDTGVTDPLLATGFEGADAAGDMSTIYSMEVGDRFEGVLEGDGDRDWVSVTLTAGETYEIALSGQDTDGVPDPFLRLHDSNGTQIAAADDSGPGATSTLTFTAPATGTYHLGAGTFGDSQAGAYRITVTGAAGAPVATLDGLADYLTDGFWEDAGGERRSFDTSLDNRITVDVSALTAEGQQLARWALEAWEAVADIRFVETRTNADITFDDSDPGLGAYAFSYTIGTTITSSTVMITPGWLTRFGTSIDSYGFTTYLHEIGHALGLGHQGNYDGTATYERDADFANDSWQVSLMSYFSQIDNTTTAASYGFPVTAMMADIIAIQNLYGAPDQSSLTAGDTTWGANTTLAGYLSDLFDAATGGPARGIYDGNDFAFTIYDRDGIDTLDLSFSPGDDRVDLQPGTFSDVGGLIGNLGITRDTIIENFIGGSGRNHVTGNDADNMLNGEGGDDTLLGGDGNDTLLGGAGSDRLFGGNGADRVDGGFGRDIAYLGDGDDIYTDTAQAGWFGADQVFGGNGNDSIQTGGGNDTLFGGNGNDTLDGGNGDDLMIGGNQGDVFYAGNGNDTVEGGNGRDTAYLGNGDDRYTDTGQSGWLGGDRVFGGAGNDFIDGGGGDDTLHGGGGDDTLAGGNNNDMIYGGAGFDMIYAGNGDDVVDAGDGRDVVFLGNGNDVFTDSAQTGFLGADRVFGGAGNDTIMAAGGNDTLSGGPGDDVFVFIGRDIEQDIITDFSLGSDALELDGALWRDTVSAPLNPDQVIARFASVTADGVVLDFGNGNTILLEGLTSTGGLAADLEIF